jgi:hypothetical protein
MAKFQMTPRVGVESEPARAGTKQAPLTDADVGKAVKLIGPSQIDLAEAGDEIFGFLSSIEVGTQDGFTIGGFVDKGYMEVDTGTVPVGTLVVVDTNPAKGTAGKTKVKAGADAVYTQGSEAVATPATYKWVVVHQGVIRRV